MFIVWYLSSGKLMTRTGARASANVKSRNKKWGKSKQDHYDP